MRIIEWSSDVCSSDLAVINLTTGGSTTMTVAERLKAALYFKPEMCSLNMGSINFALFNAAKRITEWKHDWEKAYVLGSDDYVFRNTLDRKSTRLNSSH